MEKGDIITIEITDMTEEGAGVGKADGMTVFVSGGAVYRDTVSCVVTKVKKHYALAIRKDVVKESKYRCEETCPYIDECGGCSFGALTYNVQIELKAKQLKNKLMRITGIENPIINAIIVAEDRKPLFSSGTGNDLKNDTDKEGCGTRNLGYRNKAVMAVGQGDGGEPIVGFRSAKSHRIVDCNDCRIQMPTAMAAAGAMRRYMNEYGVKAFNPRTGEGLIRHLVVRTAASTKEVMAVVVINGKELPYAEEFAYMMDDSISALDSENSLESIVISQKSVKDNSKTILGGKSYVLAGKSSIRDTLMGLEFDISAESFYQVNSRQTVKLYEEALRMLDAKEGERIMDIYCGIGTIGLIAASRSGAEFLGIEQVPQAVRDANKNAIRNEITNAYFIAGAAEDIIPEIVEGAASNKGKTPDERASATHVDYYDELKEKFKTIDAVILDPPRAGCEKNVIDAIIKAKPKRIVYVSCDQGTMARDAKLLMEGGYSLAETTPCDMFPETGSLESVSLFVR